jgi:hypothetical protein
VKITHTYRRKSARHAHREREKAKTRFTTVYIIATCTRFQSQVRSSEHKRNMKSKMISAVKCLYNRVRFKKLLFYIDDFYLLLADQTKIYLHTHASVAFIDGIGENIYSKILSHILSRGISH